MTTELDPTTFDVEAWLVDAHLPEESADVYKGGHIVAELSALKRRIENEEAVEDVERTAGDKAKLGKLEREYERLLKAFANSMLTVYVRALTGEEIRDMRTKHEERAQGMTPVEANTEFGYDLLAAAIIGVKPAGGKRARVDFTPDDVRKLEHSIGEPQLQLIMVARQRAQNSVPVVDADFLLRRSGTSEGSPE
ncbi:hypothetical protein [Arthrobacter sp. VKM Ac-2550]|uniref:hypothetical protein n=1 Tax=Crystallibacter permensis TaxID=1938888 RepID=UPI002225FF42|nr:hypothetical protein [Arthrobacter sp. VKM Ac-2550]MCW2132884.1 hypothetical protein [Arthrobacter sp. VKM Ac-2550]